MVGYALIAAVLASEAAPGEAVPRDPNSSGWDLRCLGSCGVQRDGASFHYTTSGGTVFLEYHGLVVTERKDPKGSVTLLQEEGQMTATWSDGTVVQRPVGPQVKLLVDPRLSDDQAKAMEESAQVAPFERGEAPALSPTEVRHRPGFSALAEGIAERLDAPTSSMPSDAEAHVIVVLGSGASVDVPADIPLVEAQPQPPKRGPCGCASPGGATLLLSLLASLLARRGASRSG